METILGPAIVIMVLVGLTAWFGLSRFAASVRRRYQAQLAATRAFQADFERLTAASLHYPPTLLEPFAPAPATLHRQKAAIRQSLQEVEQHHSRVTEYLAQVRPARPASILPQPATTPPILLDNGQNAGTLPAKRRIVSVQNAGTLPANCRVISVQNAGTFPANLAGGFRQNAGGGSGKLPDTKESNQNKVNQSESDSESPSMAGTGAVRLIEVTYRRLILKPGKSAITALRLLWPETRLNWLIRRETAKIVLLCHNLQKEALEASTTLESLRKIPEQVWWQSQELILRLQEGIRAAEVLQATGLHDPVVNSARVALARLHADTVEVTNRLDSLPVNLPGSGILPGSGVLPGGSGILPGENTAIKLVIATYRYLVRYEQEAGPLLHQVQQWQTLRRHTTRELQSLTSMAEDLRLHLGRLPGTIEADALVAATRQLYLEAEKLQQRNATLTLAELDELAGTVKQTLLDGTRLQEELTTVIKQYHHLQAGIEQNSRLLGLVRQQMHEIARATRCPLEWEQTAQSMSALEEFDLKIGPLTEKRTLYYLANDAATVGELAAQAQEVLDRLAGVKLRQEELVSLLESPELAADPDWLDPLYELDKELRQFDTLNWAAGLAPDLMLQEALSLADRLKRYIPARLDRPLKEIYFEQLYTQIVVLSQDRREFHKRVRQVRETLLELKQSHSAAVVEVQQALHALRLLRPLDYSGYKRRLASLHHRGNEVEAELQTTHTGLMAAKIRLAHDWGRDTRGTLQSVYQKTRARSGTARAALQADITRLQHLASYADSPLAAEDAYLTALQAAAIPRSYPVPQTLDETAALINQKQEQIEACEMALKNLAPLLSRLTRAQQNALQQQRLQSQNQG